MATQELSHRRRERRLFVTGRGGRRFVLTVRRTDPWDARLTLGQAASGRTFLYELQVVGTPSRAPVARELAGRLLEQAERIERRPFLDLLPAPDCPECEGTGEYVLCPAGHSNPPYCGCIEEYRACTYCEGTGHARCYGCGVRPGERWQEGDEGGALMFVCGPCGEVADA